MRSILSDVLAWRSEGKRVAMATLIEVERSAPLGPGATLAVNEDGAVVGSVSGGCVEPALYEEALVAIKEQRSKRLTYGISDDQAFEVGLTCGGTVHVFVFPVDEVATSTLIELQAAIASDLPVALAVSLTDPATLLLARDEDVHGGLGNAGLDHSVAADARGMTQLGEAAIRSYGRSGERRPDDVEVFVLTFAPPPDMFIFGAIDFARAVARIGKFLGYRVTVCDARATFATEKRFPEADRVVVGWPHEFLAGEAVDQRTVMCVLTHDPKFDVPLLLEALKTSAGYIGAMGSRRTHEERLQRLRDAGATDEELQRISSPIGLDIGGSTPEEVAVSIAGEIVAVRTGASGGPLSGGAGPIHKQPHGAARG